MQTSNRRKRWIAGSLAGILLLAGAAGWWYWPRGDARFVGRWIFLDSDGDESEPVGHLALYRHGMALFTVPGEPFNMSFPWRVVDGQLILGSGSQLATADDRLSAVSEYMMDWTGHGFLPGQEVYRFEIRGPDEILLFEGDGSSRLMMRRLKP